MLFFDICRLHVHRELLKTVSPQQARQMMRHCDNEVIAGEAKSLAAKPEDSLVAGGILSNIIAWFESPAGQALIKAVVTVLLALLPLLTPQVDQVYVSETCSAEPAKPQGVLMDQCSPKTCGTGCESVPGHTLIGGPENMKLLFDSQMRRVGLDTDSLASYQAGLRAVDLRRQQNAATIDHILDTAAAMSSQVGDTEAQAPVDPVRTSTDYPPIRNADHMGSVAAGAVDVAAAGVATANQSIADAVANLMNAVTASIAAASGAASASAGK